MYKWYSVPGDDFFETQTVTGIEESFQKIEETFRDRGPFDGILGFSQGGVMACMLHSQTPRD